MKSDKTPSDQNNHWSLTDLQQQMEMIGKKGLNCEGQNLTLLTLLTAGLRRAEIYSLKIENLKTYQAAEKRPSAAFP